LHPRPWTT